MSEFIVITSYSIHYTKLYEMIMDQFKKINDFLVRIQENYSTYAKHISNLSNKFSELEKENELLKSEIAELKKTIAAEALARKKEMERRITSYNVCYTKLLRYGFTTFRTSNHSE